MNIFFDGQIYPSSFSNFRNEVEASDDERIDIYVSTIGGNVDAAIATANYIQGSNREFHTHLLSNADSSGTILFLAPEKKNRHIVGSSKMFFHDPSFPEMYSVNEKEAAKAIETLAVYKSRIISYYKSRIEGLSDSDANELMSGERTLTPAEMVEYNIVESVEQKFNIAALNLKSINNMGLFSKKEDQKPLNSIALKQGDNEVNAIHEGELGEGSELRGIGEVDALNGEFISNDKKVTVENNVVKTVENVAIEDKTEIQALQAIVDQQGETIDMLMNKIEAMAGQKSTHKPQKSNVDNSTGMNESQEARQKSRDRQVENREKANENRKNRAQNLKIS